MLSLGEKKRPVELRLHHEIISHHPEEKRAVAESVLVVAVRPLRTFVVDVTKSVDDEKMDL